MSCICERARSQTKHTVWSHHSQKFKAPPITLMRCSNINIAMDSNQKSTLQDSQMEVEELSTNDAAKTAKNPNKETVGMSKRDMAAKQTARGGKEADAVTLRVSHPNLVENIRAGVNVGIEVAGDIKHRTNFQKKSNEQALKEISNKLDVGPVKFKPNRSGLKVNVGLVLKENCGQHTSNNTGLKKGEGNGQPRVEHAGLMTSPSSSRPPDTSSSIKGEDALIAPQNSSGGFGGAVDSSNEEDSPVIVQMDVAMQEVEQEVHAVVRAGYQN